jgi:CDP-glucose 4,6-dehydratase
MERLNSWKGRRVFVTGATGMVGSWLVKELLEAGAQVCALVLDDDPQSELIRSGDARRCRIVNGRLENISDLSRGIQVFEADTVFHLGAQTLVVPAQRDPLATFEANIRGTYNLLEVCRGAKSVERVVVASSDKAYGESDKPYVEDMPLFGKNPYDCSKSCTDLLAQCYYHSYGLPVAVARCGNIYGGGDLNWSRIVPGVVRWLIRGEKVILRSDGKTTRDYFYVKDAAKAYMALGAALEKKGVAGEAFNFSADTPVTTIALTERIGKLMGQKPKPVIENTARNEIPHQRLSSAKARHALNWKPNYSLDEGLRETINWYRAFLG